MTARRRPDPGPQARLWLGWAAAAAAVAAVAFIIGRAGSEVGVAPSPTPSPSVAPVLPITFGTALDATTGEATELTDRFRTGDPIAYSVRLASAAGVDTILVEIARLDADGETVVQPASQQGIVATSQVIGFTFAAATGDLLADWGPGSFVMRIYLGGARTAVAEGGFMLVETPAAT